MNKEIKLTRNLRIGIDTDAYGLAIGGMKDPSIRVTGIMFFIFYIAWKSYRLYGKKPHVFEMLDSNCIKYGNKFYRAVLHESFNPKQVHVRSRKDNTYKAYPNFHIIKEPNYIGIVLYGPNSHRPDFYLPDEYSFLTKGERVEGYISGDEIKILSIVD